MFDFLHRRKLLVELQGRVRRLRNQSTPGIPPCEGESRSEDRESRTLPALLCPWENDEPQVLEAVTAMTKDFSDRGVSLVLPQPVNAGEVVIGFWLPPKNPRDDDGGPIFFLGVVRQSTPVGGGFWQLGIEFRSNFEGRCERSVERLVPLAAKLLPPRELHRLAAIAELKA